MASNKTEIAVDASLFKRQMIRFAKVYGLQIDEVMREGMSSWANMLIRNFPPSRAMFKSKAAFTAATGATTERALGKKAVDGGLKDVFVGMLARDASKAKLISKGPMAGHYMFTDSNGGGRWLVPVDKFQPGMDSAQMGPAHDSKRIRGRTKGAPMRGKVSGWTVINKMHVKRTNLNKYRRAEHKLVGQLKGGWVAGRVFFGGKAPAAWVNQHSHMGSAGGRIDQKGNGSLVMTNRARYASDYTRVANFTARNQQKRFLIMIEKRIKKIAKEHHLTTAQARQKVL